MHTVLESVGQQEFVDQPVLILLADEGSHCDGVSDEKRAELPEHSIGCGESVVHI